MKLSIVFTSGRVATQGGYPGYTVRCNCGPLWQGHAIFFILFLIPNV